MQRRPPKVATSLRRANLWAHAHGAEQSWLFFGIAERIDGNITPPPDVTKDLKQLLKDLAPASLRTTCRGAVRWAPLRETHPSNPKNG